IVERQFDTIGFKKRDVLLDQRILRFGQYSHEVFNRERIEFNAYWEAALKLRNQIRWFSNVECPGGDKENVIGTYETIARIDGSPFHNWQNVALHAFPADVWAVSAFATRDLIDLVEKDNSAVLDPLHGKSRHLIHIDEFLLLFLNQI